MDESFTQPPRTPVKKSGVSEVLTVVLSNKSSGCLPEMGFSADPRGDGGDQL
jgi:hypothetical protein